MASKDQKQTNGGFFSSIASSLSNFGSAMHKSVNGYGRFSASSRIFSLICGNDAFLILCGSFWALILLCVGVIYVWRVTRLIDRINQVLFDIFKFHLEVTLILISNHVSISSYKFLVGRKGKLSLDWRLSCFRIVLIGSAMHWLLISVEMQPSPVLH